MFKDYCMLMPDRGDRPELSEFVISRLPEEITLIRVNYKPKDDKPDLIQRVRWGCEVAKKHGYTKVFIVENDDYYHPNYFTGFMEDFYGYQDTTYYNLRNQTWETFQHDSRSSLFCTAFKIDALTKFNWPKDNEIFLDLKLWEFAKRSKAKIELKRNNQSIGIKHGLGLCGGKGHRMTFINEDKKWEWLAARIDKPALDFYMKLAAKL